MKIPHRPMTVSGRPTKVDPQDTLVALQDMKEFFGVWPEKPFAVLDQMFHYHEGRAWQMGSSLGEFGVTTCIELEGVYASTNLDGEDGALDLINQWLKNAVKALARLREENR